MSQSSNCDCKENQNICDIVDSIEQKMDEVKINKKIEQQHENTKNQLRKEFIVSFDKIMKLINKVDRKKWIIGEYKWMPIGAKMPEGWEKVDLDTGFTLIQGSKKGNSVGALQKHLHGFENINVGYSSEPKGILYYGNIKSQAEGQKFLFMQDNSYPVGMVKTAEVGVGDVNNLAAGKYAELWQFKGTDEHKQKDNFEKLVGEDFADELQQYFKYCSK